MVTVRLVRLTKEIEIAVIDLAAVCRRTTEEILVRGVPVQVLVWEVMDPILEIINREININRVNTDRRILLGTRKKDVILLIVMITE